MQSDKNFIYDGKDIVDAKTSGLKFDNRGILFGETVFTTLRTYQGMPLFLDDHVERLKKGLEYFYEDINYDWDVLSKNILSGVSRLNSEMVNPENDIFLRITMFPENNDSTSLGKRPDQIGFFIMARRIKRGMAEPKSANVMLSRKKLYDRYLPAYVKVGTYVETARELRLAKDKGFNDVLFLNKDDYLAEGATSNLFFRKGSGIFTPDIKTGILEGITRRHLIKCLKANGFIVEEGFYSLEDLLEADEAWLSSSVKGIRPIAAFEDKKYLDSSSENSLTSKLAGDFDNYCKDYER